MARDGVVALVSGGLDSLCLLERLLARRVPIVPLYVRCGLAWEAVELWHVRRWFTKLSRSALKPLRIVRLPLQSLYGPHWSLTGRAVPSRTSQDTEVYLPGRNVFLLSCAGLTAATVGYHTLAMGVLAGNPFGDARPEFLRAFGRSLSQALSHRLAVEAPMRRLTKAQLIAAHPSLPYALTFSCLQPVGRAHCGRCNKCGERQHAFIAAHVADPTAYAA